MLSVIFSQLGAANNRWRSLYKKRRNRSELNILSKAVAYVGADPADLDLDWEDGDTYIQGFVVHSLWRCYLGSSQGAPPDVYDPRYEIEESMRRTLVGAERHVYSKAFGFIDYPVLAAAEIVNLDDMPDCIHLFRGMPLYGSLFEESLLAAFDGIQLELKFTGDAPATGNKLTIRQLIQFFHASDRFSFISRGIVGAKIWQPIATLMLRGIATCDMTLLTKVQRTGRYQLLPGSPPLQIINAYLYQAGFAPLWRGGVAAAASSEVRRQKLCVRGFVNKFDAEFCIDVVRSSRNLTSCEAIPEALDDLVRLTGKDLRQQCKDIVSKDDFEFPSRWSIARWRTRLDVAATLAERHLNHRLAQSGVHVSRELSYDASSQGGQEIFVVRERTIVNYGVASAYMQQCLLAALGHGHCGVIDKGIQVTMRLWLRHGPTESSLRAACATVALCLSDDGVEAHIADLADITSIFFEFLKTGSVPVDAPKPDGFLFPNAMRCINWNHIMDWTLLTALAHNRFFKEYTADCRLLSHFLASKGYRAVLRERLRRLDKPELASQLISYGGKFAKWRWTTQAKSTREHVRVEEAVVVGFDPQDFRFKGPELSKVVNIIRGDSNFFERNRAFAFVLDRWYRLRGWALACPCHEKDCLDYASKKKLFVCPDDRKSQRCVELWPKLASTLEEWRKDSVSMPVWKEAGLYTACSHSLRELTFNIDLKLVKMLCTWPAWLWRLREPSGCAAALADYDKQCQSNAGHARMHRLGHKFAAADSPWRAHLERHSRSEGLSPELDAALKDYERARMDESEVERPHAHIQFTVDRSTNAGFFWWASTLRLAQNLQLYDKFEECGEVELFHKFFNGDKSIMQTDATAAQKLRPVKMSREKVYSRIFNLDYVSLSDWSEFRGLYPNVGTANRCTVSGDVAWLKCDYLHGVLEKGDVFTLLVGADVHAEEWAKVGQPSAKDCRVLALPKTVASVPRFQVFEIMSFDPSKKILHYTFDLQSFTFPVVVQRHTVWMAEFADKVDDAKLHIHPYGFPVLVDGMALATWSGLRHELYRWSCSVSDVHGCLQLAYPEPASNVKMGLSCARYPAVLMLESLTSLGWKRASDCARHESAAVGCFEQSDIVKRKSYLRCLLALPTLFTRGLKLLYVRQPEGYYKAILLAEAPDSVVPNLGERKYKQLIEGDEGGFDIKLGTAALEDVPRRVASHRASLVKASLGVAAVVSDDDSDASDCNVVGGTSRIDPAISDGSDASLSDFGKKTSSASSSSQEDEDGGLAVSLRPN